MNQQQKSLVTLTENYTYQTKKSKQFMEKYRPIMADPRAVWGFNLPMKEMCYPIVGKRSSGCKIWDIDGNEYVDLVMGFGSNIFGHNPSFIKNAIAEQLEQGIQLGPQSELAGEVAELICELTGVERVAISNTGTEAVMTAIRLARAATNRSKIVMFSGSYHGHFDGTLVKTGVNSGEGKAEAIAPGIPDKIVEDVLILDYGNPRSLEIIKSQGNQLAAVLVEPVQSSRINLQPKEFLQQLRQVTETLGIALIFDEMVTGFRIHLGGAQAWFDVQADIVAYGKIVGGGMSIGIIAGKANYLDRIDGGMWNYGDASSPQIKKTFFAGTHCKHPLSMAAARAVLMQLKVQGNSLQEELNLRTSQFVNKLNSYFESEKLPIRMTNFGSLFGPISSGNSEASENATADIGINLLSYHLTHRGVLLLRGGGFLSTAHTDADLDRIFQAVKDSVAELQTGGFLPIPAAKFSQVR
ncbi:MAG TPA: aspartate aminotransferase family protein [Leptolyngbyaceae cyanobacterium]